MTKQGYTHIEMLLDRSGSMESIAKDMVGGIQTFLRDQQKVPGEATFALRQFDTIYETVIEPISLDKVISSDIGLVPRGGTALLDALGRSITACGEWLGQMSEDDRPEHVVFAIITDGEENSSKEWKHAQVVSLIKDQTEKYGWTFVYLGANQDAIQVGQGFGIARGQSQTYAATAGGTQAVYSNLSANTTNLRTTGSFGELADEAEEGK